jgi:hypothetical protein
MHPLCFVDFATMSKRLGELWATVPTNEKYVSTYTHLILVQEPVFRNSTYITSPVIF